MSGIPAGPAEGDDWRDRIAALPETLRDRLAARAAGAPLFAHSYAFHLNFRLGGMRPVELAHFAQRHGLSGLKLHVDDGEGASLGAMSAEELRAFGGQVAGLGLEIHVETSTTAPGGLSDAVARALAIGATSLRCYPLYEGRVSEIVARTIDDLRRLRRFDPEGRLRFTLEQHEDLRSDELVHIVNEVGNPNLTLLFDFANMVNAHERPLDALAAQAALITEVHVKDCLVRDDAGGWAHLACISGRGDLPMRSMLVELLLLGGHHARVRAFGLEEEEDYFAPALRFPGEEPDPFIAARAPSQTEIGTSDIAGRLEQEARAAEAQVRTIRAMLHEIAAEARRHDRGGRPE